MLEPKLRFKEFNGNWKKHCLGEIGELKNGIAKPKKYFGHGYKFINLQDIFGKNEIKNGNYELVEVSLKELKEYKLNIGDVLFVRSSVKPSGVGLASVVTEKLIDTVYSGFIIRFRENYNILNLNFKKYCFCTNSFRKELLKRSSSSANTNINQDNLSILPVYYPSKFEQERIANFFTLLDKKIELQKRKIEALKIYKKGLIQQLFNLKDCEEKHVSDFGNILTGTTPSKSIVKYWTNGSIAWITPTDITESKDIYTSNEKLTIDGLNVGRFIPAGSILITCIASIGKNAILKVNGSCNQQINAIIPNGNFNSDYLYYLFELKKNYLQSIAGTSATSIINKSTFEKLVFKVHTRKVQNKIASILNCIEQKFEIEKSKLEKLNFLKESLLQQMFI